MMKLSQGTATALLTAMKADFANCTIHLFSGTPPATASDDEGATLLVKITLDSGTFVGGVSTNGLNFDGIVVDTGANTITLSKTVLENWTGLGLLDGTPGWGRIYDNSLTTGVDVTSSRIDGSAALLSGDFTLSSATIKTGVPISIDSCDIVLPLSK